MMPSKGKEKETSQLTAELNCRIQTNEKFGNAKLTPWLIDRLHLQKGERLLDIGCGTGKHLIPFAKRISTDFACTGMDLSGRSLKDAEETAKKEDLKIRLIEKSMDDMDGLIKPSCYDDQYDIITVIYAAYYSKNISAFLENIKTMLRPGGRIAIMGPYSDNNKEWFDFLSQFMKLPDNVMESTTTFMPQKILPFAAENFDEARCFRFVNTIIIPSIEDLRRYWISNIYYGEKYNAQFEKFAKLHFEKNKIFSFKKVALLAIMEKVSKE